MRRAIVSVHTDHRGQGHRERIHYELTCDHTVTRTRRPLHPAGTEIHCPQCTHTQKTGQETRL